MSRLTQPGLHRLISYLMMFLLGVIIGAVVFLFIFGPQLDERIQQIEKLQAENEHKQDEVNRLNEQIKQKEKNNKELTVQEIEIHIEPKDKEKVDDALVVELITKSRKDVEFLIDKPLNIVSELHGSIRSIFQDKKYQIKDRTIIVNFKAISIYKTVRIWLQAEIEK